MMTVMLTGRDGQLGQELQATVPDGVTLIATNRADLDLADMEACRSAVLRYRPDWVLNAGAYTAVDRAESEPELAHAVNAGAPQAFAAALAETGGRLLQVSTDFVFDGEQGFPYSPEQSRSPLGVYGESKAAGEAAVEMLLPSSHFSILRTSWVYGPVGKNFCLTMLRLHATKAAAGESLGVVADQVGSPTGTPGLASACWRTIQRNISGLQHWSDAGAASWYDFAVAIGELAAEQGLLRTPATVRPITTADYPTPARRPFYSKLNCEATYQNLGLEPEHWRQALKAVLQRLPTP
jgi:dTDP-4-dehydrorhamnose reductase